MGKNGECIAVYSRKSKFTGKGDSIGNQAELCKEYIRVHYGEEALKQVLFFEDEGFSGGNLNRPAFRKMMDCARKRMFQAVIVYRLDRISRNISDFAGLIEELSRLDIAFISIREQFDTGTPMGRAMMYIASVFSQLERETIAERIRDNMHELAKSGRWLGGTTPTGYASEAVKSISIDGKMKKSCRLKLIPKEAEIIRMIYDLYQEHDSLALVETELMRRGIRTKNDKYFTRFSVKAILQNPVYMTADSDAYDYFLRAGAELSSAQETFDSIHGIMAYNRTNQENGKATELLPIDTWIIAVGQHPGIVSGKAWTAVQESLERNREKNFRKPRRNEALLTGVLFCSCGSRMYPKLGRKKQESGAASCHYVCKMKERSRKDLCNRRNADSAVLDQKIMVQLGQLKEDRESFIKRLEGRRRFYMEEQDGTEQRLAEMKKEREAKNTKREGLVDSLSEIRDAKVKRQVEERIRDLNRECDRMDEQICEIKRQSVQQVLEPEEFELLYRKLIDFESESKGITVEQERFVVRALIQRVVWDGVEAHVFLTGAQEEDGSVTHLCEDSK